LPFTSLDPGCSSRDAQRARAVIRFLESYFEEPRGQKLLVVGCGNSALCSELYARGYRNVLGIDLSARVVMHMQELHRQVVRREYISVCADVRCAFTVYCMRVYNGQSWLVLRRRFTLLRVG
jgi:cyclopropane fatty-acyl-phospholipid synthase-like methyltransferase